MAALKTDGPAQEQDEEHVAMPTDELITCMREMGAVHEDDDIQVQETPAQEPVFVDIDEVSGLNDGVRAALERMTGGRLYRHQAEAIRLAMEQEDRTVYLHETVPGGIGIAAKVFERYRDLLAEGVRLAQLCPCKHGCARCIHPPLAAEPKALDKAAGLIVADSILRRTEGEPQEEFDEQMHGWRRRR